METQIGLNAILQKKVNDFVERSKVDSERIYRQLENRVIDDDLIPNALITFGIFTMAEKGTIALRWEDEQNKLITSTINQHSATQIGYKIGLPPQWVADSINGERYAQEAVSFALNKYMTNYTGKDNRFLIRRVDNVVRGFLSSSYKRLNTRQIFMKFIEIAEELHLPLVGAWEGSARDYLEVLDPNLIWIETPNNGVVAYARGGQLKNADFGEGRLEFRSYWKKAVCLNGMIGQTYLKEVHLGARAEESVMFSLETVSKETEVRALKVRDAMRYVFGEKSYKFEEAQIVEASNHVVDLKQEIVHLPKLGLRKGEIQIVENLLMRRDENDGISGQPTKYMFANAISALANVIESPERSREIQQVAGNYIFTQTPANEGIFDFNE